MKAKILMTGSKTRSATKRRATTDPVVQLDHISKIYTIHHEKPTFMETMLSRTRQEAFTALKDVNLTIHKGEKIGLIGPNGSGKTTLLKIMAGITAASSGQAMTKGKVVSLIDLGAGFHPDLTGEENIFLNGLLIGMSKAEIRDQFQKIVTFSGLESFIDAPFYTYSQGMKLRLGFSVAIHSHPDILLIDEGIAVGDREFREKSRQKIKEVVNRSLTMVIVSQMFAFIEEYAQKVYVMNKGSISRAVSVQKAKQILAGKTNLK